MRYTRCHGFNPSAMSVSSHRCRGWRSGLRAGKRPSGPRVGSDSVTEQIVRSVQGDQQTATGGRGVPWWRGAVTYQLYIRSFADGNGDGLGDLAGIRDHLPYLAGLGIDAI